MRSAYQRLQGAGLLSLLLLATVASAVAQAPLQQSQKTLNAPQAQNEPPAQQSQRMHHKHLVPVNLRDILTFIAIFAGIFVASGAGVGGGAIAVPALLLIGQFNTIATVALSNAAIFASAIANMVFNAPRHSPYRPGPLIDWDLVVLLGPPTVAGSIAGSYITLSIPGWVTQSVLFFCMLPMSWRMAVKAWALWRRESAARSAAAAAAASAPKGGRPGDGPPTTAATSARHGVTHDGSPPPPGSGGRAPPRAAAHNNMQCAAAARSRSGSGSSNPTRLARISAALSAQLANLNRGSIGEVFGAELQWLDNSGGDAVSRSGSVPSQPPTERYTRGGQNDVLDLEKCQVCSDYDNQADNDVSGCCNGSNAWCSPERMGCACVLGRIWPGDRTPAVVDGGSGGGGGAAARAAAVPQPGSGPLDDGTVARVRAALLAEQSAQLPPLQVGFVVLMLAAVAASSVGANKGLPCGTPAWWAASLCALPLMLIILALARYHVLWKTAWRSALGLSQDDPCDLHWDARRTIVYPAFCIIAGMMAGMLGIGGGLVLTPLMLELGVQPAVSVASTQVVLLISSATSAIVYAVTGTVPPDYAAVLIAVAVVATFSGQTIITWIVRRTGRASVLVIVLAALLAAASVAAAAVVVLTVLELVADPSQLAARRPLCISSSS